MCGQVQYPCVLFSLFIFGIPCQINGVHFSKLSLTSSVCILIWCDCTVLLAAWIIFFLLVAPRTSGYGAPQLMGSFRPNLFAPYSLVRLLLTGLSCGLIASRSSGRFLPGIWFAIACPPRLILWAAVFPCARSAAATRPLRQRLLFTYSFMVKWLTKSGLLYMTFSGSIICW